MKLPSIPLSMRRWIGLSILGALAVLYLTILALGSITTRLDAELVSDFDAQKSMAISAQAAVFLSFISIAATAIGTVLVLLNLAETRRLAEQSAKAFAAEQRPWLTAAVTSTGPLMLSNEEVSMAFRYETEIRNIGLSVATQLSVEILKTGGLEPEKEIEDWANERFSLYQIWRGEEALFPQEAAREARVVTLVGKDVSVGPAGGGSFRAFVVVSVCYRSSIDGAAFQTVKAFRPEILLDDIWFATIPARAEKLEPGQWRMASVPHLSRARGKV